MFCTKCGNVLKDSDRFCRKCGATVKVLVPTIEPEQATAVEPASVVESAPATKVEPAPVVESALATKVEPASTVESAPATKVELASVVESAPATKVELASVVGSAPAPNVEPTPAVGQAPTPVAASMAAPVVGAFGINKSVEEEAQAALDYLDQMFAGLSIGRIEKSIPVQEAAKAFAQRKIDAPKSEGIEATTAQSAAVTTEDATATTTEVTTGNVTATVTTATTEAATGTAASTTATPETATILASASGNATDEHLAAAEALINRVVESTNSGGDNYEAGKVSDDENKKASEATESPKKSGRISRGTVFRILALLALIGAVLLWMWFFRPDDNPNLYTEPGITNSSTQNGIASHGVPPNGNAPLPAATASPLDLKDDTIMQASIKTYRSHGPNIGEIEEIYELKFTEDREYGLTGLSKAILFDDDLWYMNDIMENIHYTPELVRTMIEYFSFLQERRNNGNDLALTYIRPETDLYKEVEAIEPDNKNHRIEKMQIGEIRRSGEDFYVMLNLFETAEGEETKESLQAVHIFARAKVMEMVEINEPRAKDAAQEEG